MLSYTTPATIARNNAEAERILGRKLVGSGVDHKAPASPAPANAAKAAELLAMRKAG